MRSLARRAMRKAAPRVRRWCRRGRPEASSAETRVVSTASWTPPHNGSPFAITFRRRSSWRCAMTLRSRSKTLAATVAPASRQTLAAARKGTPGSAKVQRGGRRPGDRQESRGVLRTGRRLSRVEAANAVDAGGAGGMPRSPSGLRGWWGGR